MKKQFQNLAIECWQHTGRRLGITKHSLCLRAGPDAVQTFLLALDEIAVQGVPARRAISLKPTRRKDNCTTIRLVLSPEGNDLHQMSVTRAGDIATLEFTPAGLQSFREAVVLWLNGTEDFSVRLGGDRRTDRSMAAKDEQSAEIWFWTQTEP
jgi:hypothetical protein